MVHLSDADRAAIIESVTVPGPSGSRDRLETHIKPAFDTDDGSQFDGLLNTLADEFEAFEDELEDVTLAAYVDSAHGRQLDKIGEFLITPRNTGEADDHYRGRLKTQLVALTGGGTVWSMKQTGAALLAVDPGEIEIVEDFDVEPARFELKVEERRFDEANVTPEDFRKFLDTAKAAGVRIVAQSIGGFTYRSEADYLDGTNDPDSGYDGLDADGNPRGVGGTYTGLF